MTVSPSTVRATRRTAAGPRHSHRTAMLFLTCMLIGLMVGQHGCGGDPLYAQDAATTPEPHPAAPMRLPAELMLPDTRLELRRGTAAPFDGILFDAPTLVRWAARIQWLESRLQLEHDLHVSLEAAATQSYQELVARLTESYERELTIDRRLIDETQANLDRANRRIAELEKHPRHRAFAIGAGIGAGLTLAAGVVGAVLSH